MILDIIARTEAAIDYPDEYEIFDVSQKILNVSEKIKKLLDSADVGKIIHDGINIAIVGKPNVGKSSLLNNLAQKDSAIVTDIPGTTRDVICEYINIDGISAKILDTAGIHSTENVVENLGIEKAKLCAQNADIILLLFDCSREFDNDDKNLLSFYNSEKVLFVVNKIDLPQKFFVPDNFQLTKISAKKNFGLDDLRKNIKKIVFGKNIFDKSNEVFVCNVRHKTALKNSYDSLMRAIKTISDDLPIDLTVIDLRDAYDFLGEIIEQSVSDKIIDEIFSKFCVGK